MITSYIRHLLTQNVFSEPCFPDGDVEISLWAYPVKISSCLLAFNAGSLCNAVESYLVAVIARKYAAAHPIQQHVRCEYRITFRLCF